MPTTLQFWQHPVNQLKLASTSVQVRPEIEGNFILKHLLRKISSTECFNKNVLVRLLGPGSKQEIALANLIPRRFTGTFLF
jgi:hypothetical protein